MPDVDERIRTELRGLSWPVSVDGVLERVARRKARRRVVRRVQAAALAVAVVGGSIAGGVGLTRLFSPHHDTTLGSRPSAAPTGPNPTSAGGGPEEEQMICDQSQLYADVDGDGALDQVDVYSPSPIPSCDSPEVGQRYVLHVSGGKLADVGEPDVNFYGAETDLPECDQPHACRLFAAPEIDGDGAAEVAVQVAKGVSSFSLVLYELEGLGTAGGPHFVRIAVAPPGDPWNDQYGVQPGPALLGWGRSAMHIQFATCGGWQGDPVLVVTTALPSTQDPTTDEVHDTFLRLDGDQLNVVGTADRMADPRDLPVLTAFC